jgi:hypothetical protein
MSDTVRTSFRLVGSDVNHQMISTTEVIGTLVRDKGFPNGLFVEGSFFEANFRMNETRGSICEYVDCIQTDPRSIYLQKIKNLHK